MNVGVIVAAGRSERMGRDVDKAFLTLGTKPVIAYAVMAFDKCADIDAIVLVVRKDRVDAASPNGMTTEPPRAIFAMIS